MTQARSGLEGLAGKTVALAVTGSVAAYKAVLLARLLVQAGARVLPLMTTSAQRFVGPVTLSGICGEAVAVDMWDASFSGEKHVDLASRADVLAIVPATADVLARLAQGRADDLVTATALCAKGPVLVAPAMHPRMWLHPATQENVAALKRQGRVVFVGPVTGPVASGEVGEGRMAEPESLAKAIAEALDPPVRQDLAGKRVVITAGPTHEPIDPVRYLGNRSSGKMGFAIARRARERGADVLLISGPVTLETPPGVTRRDVESATEMQEALTEALGPDLLAVDALVMAAAVADFRPKNTSASKLKKDGGEDVLVALTPNPDLLAAVGSSRGKRTSPVLVGFALETGDDETVLAYARKKLAAKKIDLVVANAAHQSLGLATNRIAVVREGEAATFFEGDKTRVADRVLDAVVATLARCGSSLTA